MKKDKTKSQKQVPVENTATFPSKFERILAEYNLRKMQEPGYEKLTLKKISETARVSGPTVSAIYHGVQRKYGIRTLEAIAACVEATADDIRP